MHANQKGLMSILSSRQLLDAYGKPLEGGYRADYVYPKLSDPEAFGDFKARSVRYQLFWSFYQSIQYDQQVNRLAEKFRHDQGLYRHVRAVFSVGYRLGEFWATHLLGGSLDLDAGDGSLMPSALPVKGASPELRQGLSRLWRDSRWVVEKDSLARQGAIKGDAFIEVIPRFRSGRVQMRSVPPERVTDIEKDDEGHVVSCRLWEQRSDPRDEALPSSMRKTVDYHRTMTLRDDGTVDVYTYLNGQPHDWGEAPSGVGDAWTLDMPFVPLVHIEHRDIGFDFGGSELAGVLAKIAESDAVGANLFDWVYRALNGPRLLVGLKASDVTIQLDDRQKMPVYYAQSKDARVQTMLDPLPVGETTAAIAMLLAEIDHDHPELAIDKQRASGDMSGKSLREGRKPAETRVKSRRAGYDVAIVQAQRMALAMGSAYGFEGYTAFPDDPLDPAFDHQIGDRDVFQMDVFDRLEEQTSRFTMAQAARAAGMTIEDALRRAGIEADEAERARAEMQRQEMLTLMLKAGNAGPDGGGMDPALAGALAQFTTPPDPTQTETRSTA